MMSETVQFTAIRESNTVEFSQKVETLLNDGWGLRKVMAVSAGVMVYHIAYMTREVW